MAMAEIKSTGKLLSFSDFTAYSDTFIETGTHYGQGVLMALDAGFTKVRTVEADLLIQEKAYERLGNLGFVQLYFGQSTLMLPSMLSDIDKPVVFWLDAHPSGPGTGGHDDLMAKGGESEFTQDKILTREIEIILNHRSDHVILIDDQYGANPENARYTETLTKANPAYQFFFYDRQEGIKFYKEKVLACIPKS